MPLKVDHTFAAQEDLIEIWDYVAADSERAATRILHRIGAVSRLLAEQPEMGRTKFELSPDLRSFSVEGYVIYNRIEATTLRVVRVLSHYRDATNQAFPDE